MIILTTPHKASIQQNYILSLQSFYKLFIMINKDKEVGGTHYSDMKIEPIELICALDVDFIQGSIIKYVSRYKSKNGVEDLKKALHYCEIGLNNVPNPERKKWYLDRCAILLIREYCVLNGFGDKTENAIADCCAGDYASCASEIKRLIEE